MIELDGKIGHNSVISIHELFIDRYEPAHLVDQVIHKKGVNWMGQLSAAEFSFDGSAALWVSVYMTFICG